MVLAMAGSFWLPGASADTLPPGVNPPGIVVPNNEPFVAPAEPEIPAVPTAAPDVPNAPVSQSTEPSKQEAEPSKETATPTASPEESSAPQVPATAAGAPIGPSPNPAATDAPFSVPTVPDIALPEKTDLLAPSNSPGIIWNGYFKNETAYRYKEPRTITKIRNTIYLDGSYSFSPRYKAKFAGWAYYDMAYDLFDYDTIAGRQARNADQPLPFLFNLSKDKDQKGVDVRELYLDMHYDKMDVRLGRQFVVWGVLEGVRIVDEVQPVDFRELIMPDLLDYRIPLWMAKIDYYRKEGVYQLLWMPEIRVNKPAPPGSEWELLQEVPGTTYPKQYDPLNANVGLRFSTNFWDADVTFSYLYTYDYFNTVFRNIVLNQVDLAPEFFPKFTRINMYGSTISKQVGDYIVKGEVAFVTGKYFSVVNEDRNNDGILDSQGEKKRDHIRWGMGLDFTWQGMDISPGMSQWIILGYDSAMVVKNYDTGVTLFLRKEIPQHSMLFECLAINFVNLGEWYLNPRLTYSLTDNFKITPGLNLFWGKASQFGVLANVDGAPTEIEQYSQFIGNFHNNDRVYVNLKYSF